MEINEQTPTILLETLLEYRDAAKKIMFQADDRLAKMEKSEITLEKLDGWNDLINQHNRAGALASACYQTYIALCDFYQLPEDIRAKMESPEGNGAARKLAKKRTATN